MGIYPSPIFAWVVLRGSKTAITLDEARLITTLVATYDVDGRWLFVPGECKRGESVELNKIPEECSAGCSGNFYCHVSDIRRLGRGHATSFFSKAGSFVRPEESEEAELEIVFKTIRYGYDEPRPEGACYGINDVGSTYGPGTTIEVRYFIANPAMFHEVEKEKNKVEVQSKKQTQNWFSTILHWFGL